jgi:acyl-CoA synthetase (NDP forming)
VNPIFAAIMAGRGIESFEVICDSTTNTPQLQANKQMGAKILISVINAAEIIVVDFALYAQGADFSSLSAAA